MEKSSSKIHVPILLLICGLIFFTNLQSWHPTIMEARNFISAREMVEDGNWLIPTLNGETRIRKPPLPTWLTAIAIEITNAPDHLAVLRIPAAIIASLCVFFLYGLVKELFRDAGLAFYSAIVLATSFMFVEEGRTGAWDIFCNSFMVAGIWMFYKGYTKQNGFAFFALSGIFLGLSFLSKGPVAFYAMLLPFLLALFISKEQRYENTKIMGIVLCFGIAAVISLAWPVYLYFHIPDLSGEIALEEASAWIEKHNRPVWFYLHFPLFTGVWTLFLLFALFRFKKLYQVFDRKKVLLVFLWFIFTLLLLSIVPEKKERYLLPGLIPMAVLIAMLVQYWKKVRMSRLSKFTVRFHALLIALACLSFPYVIYHYGVQNDLLEWPNAIVVTILFLGCSGLILHHAFRGKFIMVFYTSIVVMVLFTAALFPLRPYISRKNPSYKNLTILRTLPEVQNVPLYTADTLNPIQLWEAGRKINTIASEQDLPSSNVGILTFSPPENKGNYSKVWEFPYDPENRERVIYLLLLP